MKQTGEESQREWWENLQISIVSAVTICKKNVRKPPIPTLLYL